LDFNVERKVALRMALATRVFSERDKPLSPSSGGPTVADVVIDAVITIDECDVDNLSSPCENA
jgi:hypothetical protein